MTDAVRYEARDLIGVITLDRPDNRNSMTPELLDAFARWVLSFGGDARPIDPPELREACDRIAAETLARYAGVARPNDKGAVS